MSRGLVSTAFADVFLWPRLLYPVLVRDWESLRRLASHRHDGTCHGGGARLAAGRRPSLTCPPETHTCAHAPLGQGQLAARTMKSKCGSFQGMGYLLIFHHWFSAKEGILENSTRTPLACVTLCLPGYAEFSLHPSVLPPDPRPACQVLSTHELHEGDGPSQTNSYWNNCLENRSVPLGSLQILTTMPIPNSQILVF